MNDTRDFLAALDDLEVALDQNVERAARMKQRIAQLRQTLGSGQPLRDVVPEEQPPLIVRLLSDSARVLDAYGSRVRRAQARALYAEGLTMDQIATLFGVSRQRVSALLKENPPSER